jgi:hypothetical protein
VKPWPPILAALLVVSCGRAEESEARGQDPAAGPSPASSSYADSVLAGVIASIDAEAARIDSIFQPLPLLQPAQESALVRFGNVQQLERARALGVGRSLSEERIEQLRRDGALVVLEDTEQWIVRDLDYSRSLAVPAVWTLLTEIGNRFHARLAALGAPAYRLEVTSVLRSAENQAALRRVNPNATVGESTHEYGTTVDVLYSAYSAPARPIVEIDAGEAAWLGPHLQRFAEITAERVAARRSLELKAILGQVLIEMQEEGKAMVTLERLQPVYHVTVASRL